MCVCGGGGGGEELPAGGIRASQSTFSSNLAVFSDLIYTLFSQLLYSSMQHFKNMN